MSTNADGTVPDKKTDDADDPTQSSPEITPPEKKKETDAKTNMKQLRKKIMKPFQNKPHGDNKSIAQPATPEHEQGGKLEKKGNCKCAIPYTNETIFLLIETTKHFISDFWLQSR